MSTFECKTMSDLKDKALELINLLPDCESIEETENMLKGFNLHYIAHNSASKLEQAEKVALFDYVNGSVFKRERQILGIS